MNLLDTEFLREFVRACDDGWHMGWHESHGGNMSYRLTDEEKPPFFRNWIFPARGFRWGYARPNWLAIYCC